MLNKLFTAVLPGAFLGCSAAGPPPPLAGHGPVLDKIFLYFHFVLPLFVFLSAGSLAAGIIYYLVFKKFPFFAMIKKNIPEEIVKERYAKGELAREEFLTLMKDLNSTDVPVKKEEEEIENDE